MVCPNPTLYLITDVLYDTFSQEDGDRTILGLSQPLSSFVPSSIHVLVLTAVSFTDLEDLIHRMVEPDLALRLSPCSTALKHPFFRNTPSPPLPRTSLPIPQITHTDGSDAALPSIITSPRPNSRKLLPTKSTSHLSVYSDRSDTSPRTPFISFSLPITDEGRAGPDHISRKAAELLGLTEKGAGPKGTPSILSAATGIGELSHGRPSGSVTTESESEEDGEEERIDEDPSRESLIITYRYR